MRSRTKRLINLAVRLARRPYRAAHFDPEGTIVKQVQSLPKARKIALVKTAYRTLDAPGRSFFRQHFMKIAKSSKDMVMVDYPNE